MNGADLIGLDSVVAFIRHSGMNYFYVHRFPSQSGSLPIYESFRNRNANEAADDFQAWAQMVGQSNENFYQITVCNADGETDTKTIKKQRTQKMRASFVLCAVERQSFWQQQQNKTPQPQPFIPNNYMNRDDVERMVKDSQELAFLKFRVQYLEQENKDLQEELDEMDDNDDDNFFGKVMEVMAGANGKKQPTSEGASVSGVQMTDEIRKDLNRSINILWKHDPYLHTHLRKLANLASTNTSKFNVLIEMLDMQL